MRYLLQRPLQDEIWSSSLIRSVRRAGVSIGVATQLLSVSGRPPSFFSTRYLREVARFLSMNEFDVLAEHTVLPYVMAFFEERRRLRVTEAALSAQPTATYTAAVAQLVADYVPFRRYCAACARHELSTVGESFWHLSHHLPSVLICTLHQSSLLETDQTTGGRPQWSYALPHEASGRRLLPGRPTSFELELARRSLALLGTGSFFGPTQRPRPYRRDLLAKGLAYDQTFSGPKLARWLHEQLGAQPTRLRLPNKDVGLKWAARLVRAAEDGTSVPPVKHLILETAIALSETELAPQPNRRFWGVEI